MTKQQDTAKIFKKICRKAGVTLRDHEMLAAGDHILLGLSGGKDSMIMLEVLAERRAALPFDFKITAAYINLENIDYRVEEKVLSGLCEDLNIEFIVDRSEIDLEKDTSKNICFSCSWNRRKRLFELTKSLDCNKVALGHHRYDALETLLINMIYHGSISSLPYTLSIFDGRVKIIRPLLDMDENLLRDYAQKRGISSELKICPHERDNKRQEARKIIDSIEVLHGSGPINMFRSMNKIFEEYLPQKKARTS